jgi:small-conductance mechanosensitive channel
MIARARFQETEEILTNKTLTSGDWIEAGGTFLVALLVAAIVSRLLRRIIRHGIGHGFAAIIVARVASYSITLIGLFYALTTLGVRVGPLLGALGLGGLVVALALQGLVENFVSSVILQTGRPFTIGDTVKLDSELGQVIDIDARSTILTAFDGRHVRIPNKNVLSSTIINLTRAPERRSTLTVGVAYDSDLEHAYDVLLKVFERVPRVLESPAPQVVLTGFGASSIDFELYYWHRSDVPSELAAQTDLTIAVHQALTAENITIAFPQMVLWTAPEPSEPYSAPKQAITTHQPQLEQSESSARRWGGPPFRW